MRPRPLPAPLLADAAVGVLLAVWWVAEMGDLSGIGTASLVLCTVPLGWRRIALYSVAVHAARIREAFAGGVVAIAA